MAKRQSKVEEINPLAAIAKEFMQYYPNETNGYVSEDGTGFLGSSERRAAIAYATANKQSLYEYNKETGVIDFVTVNEKE